MARSTTGDPNTRAWAVTSNKPKPDGSPKTLPQQPKSILKMSNALSTIMEEKFDGLALGFHILWAADNHQQGPEMGPVPVYHCSSSYSCYAYVDLKTRTRKFWCSYCTTGYEGSMQGPEMVHLCISHWALLPLYIVGFRDNQAPQTYVPKSQRPKIWPLIAQ